MKQIFILVSAALIYSGFNLHAAAIDPNDRKQIMKRLQEDYDADKETAMSVSNKILNIQKDYEQLKKIWKDTIPPNEIKETKTKKVGKGTITTSQKKTLTNRSMRIRHIKLFINTIKDNTRLSSIFSKYIEISPKEFFDEFESEFKDIQSGKQSVDEELFEINSEREKELAKLDDHEINALNNKKSIIKKLINAVTKVKNILVRCGSNMRDSDKMQLNMNVRNAETIINDLQSKYPDTVSLFGSTIDLTDRYYDEKLIETLNIEIRMIDSRINGDKFSSKKDKVHNKFSKKAHEVQTRYTMETALDGCAKDYEDQIKSELFRAMKNEVISLSNDIELICKKNIARKRVLLGEVKMSDQLVDTLIVKNEKETYEYLGLSDEYEQAVQEIEADEREHQRNMRRIKHKKEELDLLDEDEMIVIDGYIYLKNKKPENRKPDNKNSDK